MAMSPETQKEYDAALKQATIQHGGVLDHRTSTFGWEDYRASEHLRRCGGVSNEEVEEDDWYEFAGTFAGPEEGHKHGLLVSGVTCLCGELADRSVRWDADRSEIAEAVFEIALGPKRR